MEKTIALLNTLFADPSGVYSGRFLEVTYIHPAPPRGWKKVMVHSFEIGKEQPSFDAILAANAAGYGIYYGVTPRDRRVGNPVERTNRFGRKYTTQDRGSEKDTTVLNALWAEIDTEAQGRDKGQAYDEVTNMTLIPPIVIDSGGGLHLIWPILPHFINDLVEVKLALKGLAMAVGGDPSVADLARVLRMPGTVNTKPSRRGAPCKVLFLLEGARYRWEDFAEYVALARPTVEPTPRRPMPITRKRVEQPRELPRYIMEYIETPHSVGTRNNALNCAAYYMGAEGYSESEALEILLPRAMADGLSESEIRSTIKSAFNPGKPGTSSAERAIRRRAAAAEAVRKFAEALKGRRKR